MVLLNGSNYHLWNGKIKDILFIKKLHLSIFIFAKSNLVSDKELEFEHLHVCGFIRQYVEDNVYNHTANETRTKTLWEKIKSLYASKSGNSKSLLFNSFISLKYMEETFIRSLEWISRTPWSNHLSGFQRLLDQM